MTLRLIASISVLVVASGCASTRVHADYQLVLHRAEIAKGPSDAAVIEQAGGMAVYRDSQVELTFRVGRHSVTLAEVRNLSESPLMLDRPSSSCASDFEPRCRISWSGDTYGAASKEVIQVSALAHSWVIVPIYTTSLNCTTINRHTSCYLAPTFSHYEERAAPVLPDTLLWNERLELAAAAERARNRYHDGHLELHLPIYLGHELRDYRLTFLIEDVAVSALDG
jgi:hypothetical protein